MCTEDRSGEATLNEYRMKGAAVVIWTLWYLKSWFDSFSLDKKTF